MNPTDALLAVDQGERARLVQLAQAVMGARADGHRNVLTEQLLDRHRSGHRRDGRRTQARAGHELRGTSSRNLAAQADPTSPKPTATIPVDVARGTARRSPYRSKRSPGGGQVSVIPDPPMHRDARRHPSVDRAGGAELCDRHRQRGAITRLVGQARTLGAEE